METLSFVVSVVSLLVGLFSIVLAIYSINSSKKESIKSHENYINTKDLLKEIEHKANLIDQMTQTQQKLTFDIICKMLDKMGEPHVELKPITMNDFENNKSDDLINNRISILEKEVEKIPTAYVENGVLYIKSLGNKHLDNNVNN